VNEGLPRAEHARRHRPGDLDGRRGIALEGEEGLTDGDLDLLVDVGNDVVIAANDTNAGGRIRAGRRELVRAIQQQALGDVVRVVVDERLLDQLVQVVQ